MDEKKRALLRKKTTRALLRELVVLTELCVFLGVPFPKPKLEKHLERLQFPKIG